MNTIITLLRSPYFWMLAAVLLPDLAFAAGAASQSMLTPPSTDLSLMNFIHPAFEDANSPLVQVSLAFNSGALLIGGMLVTYTLVVGTMNTAHDGEMLGKQWSSMWLPVRTAMGSAMVMPLSAKGLCGAQLLVVYIITSGVGFADFIWNSYAKLPQGVNVVGQLSDKTPVDAVTESAVGMFRNNLCMETLKSMAAAKNPDGSPANIFGGNTFGSVATNGGSQSMISYGSTSSGFSETSCGKVTLDNPSKAINNTQNDPVLSQLNNRAQTIQAAKYQQLLVLNDAMDKLAVDWMNSGFAENGPPSVDLASRINTAVQSYLTGMNQAVNAAAQDHSFLSSFQEQAAKDGWWTAGMWFMTIVRFQDTLSTASKPAPAAPRIDYDFEVPPELYKSQVNALRQLKNSATQKVRGQLTVTGGAQNTSTTDWLRDPNSTDTSLKNIETSMMESNNIFGSMLRAVGHMENVLVTKEGLNDKLAHTGEAIKEEISKPVLDAIIRTTAAGSGWGGLMGSQSTGPVYGISPILAAKSLGDSLIDAGWITIGATITVGFVSSAIASMLFPISLLLWAEGVSLSVILPMTPYVVWFTMLLAWMAACIEAFFAAPLWAIMHLHPEGNDAVGKGASGYMLLFSLAVRPALMIVGLIAAFVMMSIAGNLLFSTIKSGISLSGFDSDLISTVGIIFVYIGLMTLVVKNSIGLVHVIPDKILSWIGGPGGDLTQSAGQGSQMLDQHGQRGANALIGTQQALGNYSRGKETDRQNKSKKRQEAADQAYGEAHKDADGNAMTREQVAEQHSARQTAAMEAVASRLNEGGTSGGGSAKDLPPPRE